MRRAPVDRDLVLALGCVVRALRDRSDAALAKTDAAGRSGHERVLSWVLVVEDTTMRLEGPEARVGQGPGVGQRLRQWLTREARRGAPRHGREHATDAAGVILPRVALRTRAAEACAAFSPLLHPAAHQRVPAVARVPHATLGALTAVEWAGQFLVLATDLERALLRAEAAISR